MRRSLINEWLKAKEDEKHIDYNFLESVPYVNGKTLVQYNCIRDLAPFCGHFNSSFVWVGWPLLFLMGCDGKLITGWTSHFGSVLKVGHVCTFRWWLFFWQVLNCGLKSTKSILLQPGWRWRDACMLPSYFHVSSEIVGVTVLPKPFMMSGKIRNIFWRGSCFP